MEQLLKDVFAIEVPEGAKDFGCVHVFHGEDVLYYPDGDGQTEPIANAPCHCDQVEILFTTKVFNDSQAASVVAIKEANGYPIGYKDYENDDESYREAVHSLESLLRSKNLDPAKNYLLIRKL